MKRDPQTGVDRGSHGHEHLCPVGAENLVSDRVSVVEEIGDHEAGRDPESRSTLHLGWRKQPAVLDAVPVILAGGGRQHILVHVDDVPDGPVALGVDDHLSSLIVVLADQL